MKKVSEFMNKDVIFFKPEDTLFDVATVFAEKNISGAPVVGKDKVVGVISISDIVKFMSLKVGKDLGVTIPSLTLMLLSLVKIPKDHRDFKNELERISKVHVKDVMSKEIACISPDASVFEAADIMEKHDVNRLPVIENGRLAGIIARADLIKALLK